MPKAGKRQKRKNCYREVHFVMGTVVEILLEDSRKSEAELVEIVHRGFAEFEFLAGLCSRFDSSSELSLINQTAATVPVSLSETIFEILALGLIRSRQSQGAFSIGLLPLIQCWSEAFKSGKLPTQAEIAVAQAKTNLDQIELNPATVSVFFKEPGMGLDLGGFAKGWAVDAAREVMEAEGVERGFINAGTSSLAGFGSYIELNPWKIGLRHPINTERQVGVLELGSRSLSTSGSSEQWFEISGTRFSHLLNPQTGWPMDWQLAATVVTSSAADAEVASKMLLFHGLEKGTELCDKARFEIEACVLHPAPGNEEVEISFSAAFPFLPEAETL